MFDERGALDVDEYFGAGLLSVLQVGDDKACRFEHSQCGETATSCAQRAVAFLPVVRSEGRPALGPTDVHIALVAAASWEKCWWAKYSS